MNYLGHLFLSGTDEQLLVGNFIGDFVKGKQYTKYPVKIQSGILLHREIDWFTDRNSNWMEIREMLRPVYNRYAGVVADMFVDHFLASNWEHFSDQQLSWYAKWVYAVFLKNFDKMPQQVQNFIPYFIQHRRLQSYAEIAGIDTSLRILSTRRSLPENTDNAIINLKKNYSSYKKSALLFVEEIGNHVDSLISKPFSDFR
jgi:acyl carrier protein phosphodiesterase